MNHTPLPKFQWDMIVMQGVVSQSIAGPADNSNKDCLQKAQMCLLNLVYVLPSVKGCDTKNRIELLSYLLVTTTALDFFSGFSAPDGSLICYESLKSI